MKIIMGCAYEIRKNISPRKTKISHNNRCQLLTDEVLKKLSKGLERLSSLQSLSLHIEK